MDSTTTKLEEDKAILIPKEQATAELRTRIKKYMAKQVLADRDDLTISRAAVELLDKALKAESL